MEAEPATEQDLDLERLLQRHNLYEKLSRVQRSISHGAQLEDVLDSITGGASEVFGDEVVALRLIDEDDPSACVIVSSCGLKEHLQEKLHRMPVGQGAGGLAIRRNELVVIQDYSTSPKALEALARDGLTAAMAAPVHETGEVVGSLAVASYEKGRRYSDVEQEALLAFAQHASLALTDARAVEALREAQRSKEMFLAMVSHELKSPLTVILGTLFTLLKHHQSVVKETLTEMLTSAYERAKELSALVNRVLEGARAELAARQEDVLLSDVVKTGLRGFEQARPLKTGDLPHVLIRVDAAAVRQILGILLENAVSHSPPGEAISIGCNLTDSTVELSVTNAGRLPEDVDPESLFVPFSRGAGATSQGVGLGLYIASRLASAIGGKIDVTSADETVTFTLRFPLQAIGEPRLGVARTS